MADDIGEASNQAADQYIVFNSTQIKAAEANSGACGPSDANIYAQKKRGSIQVPAGGVGTGKSVITLFDKADLSTVIHESGHYFLEVFTALANSNDAPIYLKAI